MTHIMELLGKAKVYIENEKIIKIEDPNLKYCPLFNKLKNIQNITKQDIEKNIYDRMTNFGLFTTHRVLDEDEDYINFGVSEVISSALRSSLIDIAVTVCDGVGTFLTQNPSLVQAVGGRIQGLIQTDPIQETIIGIEERNGFVLDKSKASIDQLFGVKKAIELGYKKIAVTITDINVVKEIRNYEKQLSNKNIQIIIIAVHVSGISLEDSKLYQEYTDIITTCASKHLRELNPIFQVGISIPLFAFTKIGKLILIERMKYMNMPLLATKVSLPYLPDNKQPNQTF